jgi:Tol biopolymer transport system component
MVAGWLIEARTVKRAAPLDHSLARLDVDLGPESVPAANLESVISPDGTRLVYLARSSDGKRLLATRLLNQTQVTFLTGTENGAVPFFSPDGQWIGFIAGGQMKKISVQGGAVITICDSGISGGASWGKDQNIVFAAGATSSLMRVSSAGGKPQPLTMVGENGDATHRWPQILPGGRSALFTSHKIITGFDDATIESVVLSTGARKTVLRGATTADTSAQATSPDT